MVNSVQECDAGGEEEILLSSSSPAYRCFDRLWRHRFVFVAVLDFCLVLVALRLTFFLRYNFDWPLLRSFPSPDFMPLLRWSMILGFVWILSIWREGGYRGGMRGVASRLNILRSVIVGGFYALVLLLAISFLHRDLHLSRAVYVGTGLFGVLFMLALRVGICCLEKSIHRRGLLTRKIALAGSCDHLREFLNKLRADDKHAEVAGVLQWEVDGSAHQTVPEFANYPVYETLRDLPEFYRDRPFDELFLAPSVCHGDRGKELKEQLPFVLEFCERRGISLYCIPPSHAASVVLTEAGTFYGTPIQQLRPVSISKPQQAVKRSMDVAVSCSALILGAPIWLAICAAVKFTSPGPVFYGQERLKRNGKLFTAWKFRTMVENADDVLEGYLDRHPELRSEWEKHHKLKDDPRVTFTGRILRKFSLDELPQFWNVLKGDMSVVGPRPIVEQEIYKYGNMYDLYCHVKPGITGLWQVSGRSNTSYQERIYLDQYYVKRWSLWMDVFVIFKTAYVIITRRGAC